MSRNCILLLVALLTLATPASAQVTITYSFTNGTAADADQVNANFTALSTQALNRTGGAITGNITVGAGVTIDGVDVGAVLGGTGTPTFSTVTVSSAAAGAITVTGGITAGSGAVGIVNTTGKIPALSTTYFADVSGANLTALNATQVTTGTLPLARLVGITSTEILDGTLLNVDINAAAAIAWTKISKVGSSLADLATRSHTELSDGANVAMLNASATFTDILGISTKYWSDTSSTAVNLTIPNQTIAPGNSSIVYLNNADVANSVQTINSGVEGRVIHFCNVGSASFVFSAGTNIVVGSGGISPGQCSTLIFHSSFWYYFD